MSITICELVNLYDRLFLHVACWRLLAPNSSVTFWNSRILSLPSFLLPEVKTAVVYLQMIMMLLVSAWPERTTRLFTYYGRTGSRVSYVNECSSFACCHHDRERHVVLIEKMCAHPYCVVVIWNIPRTITASSNQLFFLLTTHSQTAHSNRLLLPHKVLGKK